MVQRGGRTPGEIAVSELKKISGFEDYSKALGSDCIYLLLEKTKTAVQNSRRALEDANATGEENPSTKVHLIVEYLEEAKEKSSAEAGKSN